MALYKLDRKLVDPLGKPLLIEGKHFTVGEVLLISLLGQYQEDPFSNGEGKLRRYKLAQKLGSQNMPELTAEDIVMLKKYAELNLPAWPFGFVCDVLDSPYQNEGHVVSIAPSA
jgi:hypothetical protein